MKTPVTASQMAQLLSASVKLAKKRVKPTKKKKPARPPNLTALSAAKRLRAACEGALEWLACDVPEEATKLLQNALAREKGAKP